MEENIQFQVCERCRKDIDRQLDTTDKRLNVQSDDLKELTRISDRLTQLLETMNERVTALEQQNNSKNKFYNSDALKMILRALIVIAVMIVAAAIGQNINWKAILG